MSDKRKLEAIEDLEEEYYQISPDILLSFNKFRPPLNIYKLKEDVVRLFPYYKVGERLSKEQGEELEQMVREGLMFVSRADHPVYVKHISFQLDLVLMDRHLTEAEIADIFQTALTRRMEEFLDQPVKAVADKIVADVMVLTEYLWQDFNRGKALARRVHTKHTLANHSVNCGLVGLQIFIQTLSEDFRQGPRSRQTFDRTALGLFLHDVGMSKIPQFLRDKTQTITSEERQKFLKHPLLGVEMLSKLDLKFPEVEQCVLQHHERVGGGGYPQKLSGADISDAGLLTAVVDSFCAMITERPHAKAMEPMAAAGSIGSDGKYDSRYSKQLATYLVNTRQA
ncbi:HD-GYP domain-containing protein [Fundidesulfovibrio putealis]|uniref:HD-GYP domain-containing protein n=1 Tax=Fundidesulfovibrio putealis TaxID=270496 RepID=UPI00041C3024|nr:HD domain-containing phosphohydrolase [Fundidesulfovibrio putealis]